MLAGRHLHAHLRAETLDAPLLLQCFRRPPRLPTPRPRLPKYLGPQVPEPCNEALGYHALRHGDRLCSALSVPGNFNRVKGAKAETGVGDC
jgi:hypothetical protein